MVVLQSPPNPGPRAISRRMRADIHAPIERHHRGERFPLDSPWRRCRTSTAAPFASTIVPSASVTTYALGDCSKTSTYCCPRALAGPRARGGLATWPSGLRIRPSSPHPFGSSIRGVLYAGSAARPLRRSSPPFFPSSCLRSCAWRLPGDGGGLGVVHRVLGELRDKIAVDHALAALADNELADIAQGEARIGLQEIDAVAVRAVRPRLGGPLELQLLARGDALALGRCLRSSSLMTSITLRNAASGICARPAIQRSSVFSGTRSWLASACVLPWISAARMSARCKGYRPLVVGGGQPAMAPFRMRCQYDHAVVLIRNQGEGAPAMTTPQGACPTGISATRRLVRVLTTAKPELRAPVATTAGAVGVIPMFQGRSPTFASSIYTEWVRASITLTLASRPLET